MSRNCLARVPYIFIIIIFISYSCPIAQDEAHTTKKESLIIQGGKVTQVATKSTSFSLALHTQKHVFSDKTTRDRGYALKLERKISKLWNGSVVALPTSLASSLPTLQVEAVLEKTPYFINVFEVPSTDQKYVSAAIIRSSDGQVIEEKVVQDSQSASSIIEELSNWLTTTLPTLQPSELDSISFLQSLAKKKRCKDFNEFLRRSDIDLDYSSRIPLLDSFDRCKTHEYITSESSRRISISLKSGRVPVKHKGAWYEALPNSELLRFLNERFHQDAILYIDCKEDCSNGSMSLRFSVEKDFIKLLVYSPQSIQELIRDLASAFLGYRQEVAQNAPVPSLPISMEFSKEDGEKLTVTLRGSPSVPRVRPNQKLGDFF